MKLVLTTIMIVATAALILSLSVTTTTTMLTLRAYASDDSVATSDGPPHVHCSCAVKAPDDDKEEGGDGGHVTDISDNGGGNGHNHNGGSGKHHKNNDDSLFRIPNGGSVSTTLGGDSSNAVTTGSAPADNGGLLNLNVSNVKVFKNLAMKSYSVTGKVSNNDTINTLQGISVNVQFFDKADTLLGETGDGTDSLAPGQTWSFKVSAFPEILENQPITAVDHYIIKATGMTPLQ